MSEADAAGDADQRSRFELANALLHAIEAGQLELSYQPLVRTGDGGVTGVEALVRWNDPQRGAITPAVMLPLARERGLMAKLGQWVIGAACTQVASWKRSGIAQSVQLHVNLSDSELADPGLTTTVVNALDRSGLKPADLCLEVTERDLRAVGGDAIHSIRALSKFGVDFALDNFGRGSSIDVLTIVSFSHVKIERALICGEGGPSNRKRMLKGIRGLTRALDITMVAESVELQSEIHEIAALGFSQAQGYAFGRPADASTVERSLSSERSRFGFG